MANTDIYSALEKLENFFQNSLDLVTSLQSTEEHSVEELLLLREILVEATKLSNESKPSLALATSQAHMRKQKAFSDKVRAEKRARKLSLVQPQV